MQIFIYPQATPQAMPRAIFQNFRIFQNFSPRRRLRLRLQANKNLHIPSGYALSILLHNICPQAMPKFAYAKFLFSNFPKSSARGLAPGHASGNKIICIIACIVTCNFVGEHIRCRILRQERNAFPKKHHLPLSLLLTPPS
ncbi:hypothetical protein T4A_11381 [Trichinella pseudospiralis]|uniref:Uncharacterized protein n=1 Tax=Trichinella pseudospiralis TaxID=6337 RepID=A0A0V1EHV6_TRIPS|nr:hypothetical protein T4A_11381 [Trichinella pseudospiralis]